MTFYKNSVMVTCLLLSLCVATCPQDKPKAEEVTADTKIAPHQTGRPCSTPTTKEPPAVTINLCPSTKNQPEIRQQKQMELRGLNNNSIWVNEHPDDVVVWKATIVAPAKATPAQPGKQVAWTCSSQSFQLVSIVRIRTNPGLQSKSPVAPPPADSFPFCDGLKTLSGDTADPNKQFAAGSTLYSGPPKPTAENGCYKYTFLVGGNRRDPHIIITDPPGVYQQARQALPKCDFAHRVTDSSSPQKQ